MTNWLKRMLGAKDGSIVDRDSDTVAFAAGQYGAYAASSYVQASNEMSAGMELFKQVAAKYHRVPVDKLQGNLFEYIEAAKFNANAAGLGDSVRAWVTAANGDPHAAADILYKINGKAVGQAQAKSYQDAVQAACQLSNPKYADMQKIVTNGTEERVRELAEKRASSGALKADDYADTARNVSGEARYGQVGSGGTTREELMTAVQNPRQYANVSVAKRYAVEAGAAGANAAVAGAVMGGAISGMKNCLAAANGKISWGQAAKHTAKDVAKSGVRSGVTGATGAVIRAGAKEAGLRTLAKSNVATAVAASLIDIGVVVYDLAKGEITAGQAAEKIGQTGVSTVSSIYAGAAAGAIFGPAGALIGSVAGYMVASNVYQAGLAVLKQADLAAQEAARVTALCEEACREMRQQRILFEDMVTAKLKMQREQFNACFAIIDQGVLYERPDQAVAGLAQFAALFGRQLTFAKFDEFDDFMKNSDQPLML